MKWRNTTRGGKPVRIYAEDGEPDWPIHGAIKTDQGWALRAWRRDGTWAADELDLIPATPIIDWSAQPVWCKAVAMDKDGMWCRFDAVPCATSCMWLRGPQAGFCQPMHPSEFPAFDGDWKDSLCVRTNPTTP